MSITTTTHLNFRGDARGALDFYRTVFGGTATVSTTVSVAVSMTSSTPSSWLGTHSREPSGVTAEAIGRRPTGMVVTMLRLATSSTPTRLIDRAGS